MNDINVEKEADRINVLKMASIIAKSLLAALAIVTFGAVSCQIVGDDARYYKGQVIQCDVDMIRLQRAVEK